MRLEPSGKNDPFSSVPGGSIGGARLKTGPSTTFDPIPLTIAAFHEKPQAFYLRFVFALFVMVEGSGLNVVDGPISWQTGHAAALAKPK